MSEVADAPVEVPGLTLATVAPGQPVLSPPAAPPEDRLAGAVPNPPATLPTNPTSGLTNSAGPANSAGPTNSADGHVTATRRLLRRLRNIMAGSGSAQERLDRIVRIVAAEVVAEVCSAYVMRAGEVLELFATEGLRTEAVHRTRLRVGEGLVGVIAATARPLALADAQAHPDFAYRPETGEEIYHSLMGVPILRGGRVLGVLVVQNRTPRHYSEDETEVLQTIAMIVAELTASGELVNPLEMAESRGGVSLPMRLDGIRLNPGLAIGPALLHEPNVVIRQVIAEDIAAEQERLRQAVAAMQDAIDRLVDTSRRLGPGEHRDIIETYRMFAEDSGWLGRITEAVHSGLTAEAAVQKVRDETKSRMMQVSDPYLRERLYDLEDLANRLQRFLSGQVPGTLASEMPSEFVLVAHAMGPAELLDYAHRRIKGLVLEEGSPTAHVSIVARAFDIPVVGRVSEATRRIETGDTLIVDGEHGGVLIRPRADIQQSVALAIEARGRRRAFYDTLRDAPAVTRDGVPVRLMLNAGLLLDIAQIKHTGAEGIGLFRTEIPLLTRNAFPDVADQAAFYRRAYEQADGKPIIFRTLDIGGDKVLPYLSHTEEENPAMGWRAIRIGLDRPAMLRQQLRALLRAAAGRDLYIKFPMIAEIAEFDAARNLLRLEQERCAAEGYEAPRSVKLGVMLEVPALLWQLPALLQRIDFLSMGTNDLAQFLYACDRGNPRLAERYDLLSAPMVALFRQVIAQCRATGTPLSICGEMAGSPIEAMVLIGLGFRTLSLTATAIGPVKAMIRSLDAGAVEGYLNEIGDRPDHSLRRWLEAYARDHAVVL
ncbi:MAG TPA: phosphoenolpyruvate--protein phosphotransferase [Stellaceae bacterium]|jgi:phosphotransferase system enzyme I (PtsP)|nr:phosphoenolpyruvate--protein phosphotransferase [Stellaceae bacterium]